MTQQHITSTLEKKWSSNGQARESETRNALKVAYVVAIIAAAGAFIVPGLLRGVALWQSFTSKTPGAVIAIVAILVPFIIETSRAAALLWSVADAARSRYYSSAIGAVISIAFVWHELANVEQYVEAAGGNQLVLASVKFIIVAALLIEARLIAGLFRK
jgi:hypothetical protein